MFNKEQIYCDSCMKNENKYVVDVKVEKCQNKPVNLKDLLKIAVNTLNQSSKCCKNKMNVLQNEFMENMSF